MMVETPCQTEQLGHVHVLAKDGVILYIHVCNIKIIFLFEVWNIWIGWACETTNQVEVALPSGP